MTDAETFKNISEQRNDVTVVDVWKSESGLKEVVTFRDGSRLIYEVIPDVQVLMTTEIGDNL